MAKYMAMKIKIFFLLFILIGCSSTETKHNTKTLYDIYLNSKNPKEPIDLSYSMVNKIKETINLPFVEIRTNGELIQSIMVKATERDGYFNYLSGSGQTITTEGALITKTNGMNTHLISVLQNKESPIVVKLPINQWKTQYREYSFLTSNSEVKSLKFECFYNIQKDEKIIIASQELIISKIVESCKSNDKEFENIYWADNTGYIWKSKQWISLSDIYASITNFENNNY